MSSMVNEVDISAVNDGSAVKDGSASNDLPASNSIPASNDLPMSNNETSIPITDIVTVVMDSDESNSNESGASESEDDNQDPISMEIVEALESSVAFNPHDESDVNRVIISKNQAEEIRVEIWKDGVGRFLKRLMSDAPLKFTASQVLSALGFPLLKSFVNKIGEKLLSLYVHAAIRYSMKSRQKLAFPHNLDEFCRVLDSASNIIVLTGAGISTSLGIPDFRSQTGLYSRLEHLGIDDPQEVFSMNLFREDPSIFFRIAKDILPEQRKYTPTHQFIHLLEEKGKLLRNYTQNIDNLERYAGISSEKLVQCHGSFATATCVTCGYKVDGEKLFDDIRSGKVARCPICQQREQSSKRKRDAKSDDENDYGLDQSQGVMKPDITFFGEQLPDRFDRMLFGDNGDMGDARKCDLLICIGTSLQVAPVADIVRVIPPNIPQVYISKTLSRHNTFDVTFLGSCDDVVELIEEKMGWISNHEMHKRHLIGGKSPRELFYPGGRVVYEEMSSTYRFEEGEGEGEGEADAEVDAGLDAGVDAEVDAEVTDALDAELNSELNPELENSSESTTSSSHDSAIADISGDEIRASSIPLDAIPPDGLVGNGSDVAVGLAMNGSTPDNDSNITKSTSSAHAGAVNSASNLPDVIASSASNQSTDHASPGTVSSLANDTANSASSLSNSSPTPASNQSTNSITSTSLPASIPPSPQPPASNPHQNTLPTPNHSPNL